MNFPMYDDEGNLMPDAGAPLPMEQAQPHLFDMQKKRKHRDLVNAMLGSGQTQGIQPMQMQYAQANPMQDFLNAMKMTGQISGMRGQK